MCRVCCRPGSMVMIVSTLLFAVVRPGWKAFSIMPSIPGFELFCSPALSRPFTSGILPGSATVSSALRLEHPVICDTVGRSCFVLNVPCCITKYM